MIESQIVFIHSLLKPSRGPALSIAFLAIYRAGAIGFKRNLCFLSAISTCHRMHFSGRSVISTASTSSFSIHIIIYLCLIKFSLWKLAISQNANVLYNTIQKILQCVFIFCYPTQTTILINQNPYYRNIRCKKWRCGLFIHWYWYSVISLF